jgi:hypothetical protein
MDVPARIDLYGPVHKALRARLFDLCVELDRCNFERQLEVSVALGVYRRTMAFVREHHRRGEQFIEPLLEGCGHAKQRAGAETLLAELDGLMTALDRAEENRQALGARVCVAYRRFLIPLLDQMQREETEGNAVLWQRYSDGELLELRARLQSSIPAERFGEWLEIMLPALNLVERVRVLRGVEEDAPAPAFAAATAIASRVLGAAGWKAVREQLDGERRPGPRT